VTQREDPNDDLIGIIGQEVVLDATSRYVLVGTLAEVGHAHVVLINADVHDLRDSTTTRELYVLETRRHGIRANRHRVMVRRDEIVSISRLQDVVP